MNADQYLAEVIDMLNRQPGDYTIGRNEREIVAMCHKLNRPIANCVGLLMRLQRA